MKYGVIYEDLIGFSANEPRQLKFHKCKLGIDEATENESSKVKYGPLENPKLDK